jgi:hypothetical protein
MRAGRILARFANGIDWSGVQLRHRSFLDTDCDMGRLECAVDLCASLRESVRKPYTS